MNRKSQGVLATAFALCSTLSCSDKSTDITGTALNDSTAASALAVTNPAPVTDLQAAVTGSTSVTLSFTQVDDGTGQPAKYDVRYAVAPIQWGSATAQTSGTCNTPVAGTAIGSQLSCTVLGLTPATNYNFQLVSFRGTLNLNAVFGSLSSIASATTTASTPPPPAPVASVSVLPASSTLQIGATVQLQVTAHDSSGNVLTGRIVTSSSADTTIASVNSLGLVTAVSAGTTQITVTSEGKSAIATITVTAAAPPPPGPVPVASVTVSPASSTLLIGATVQLQVTALDANGNVLTGRVVTSSSANAGIASVNSLGLVTAISAGTTQITVTSETKSAIATITVTALAPVPVASVTVSPATSSLLIGATVQLLVTALDANGNVLTGRVVTSSSANAAIASVNSLGLVTAVSAGTTQITVISEGKSAVATITVSATPPPVTNPSAVTNLQASATGSTSVTLSFTQVNDGTGQPAKYDVRYAVAPISWGSATAQTSGTCNTPVAGTAIGSQLSCTVLGLTPATNYNFQLVAFRGTLNLNAVFGSLSSIVSATTTATAPPPPIPVASVSVTPTTSNLLIGATVQLLVTALDANGNVLTGRVVTSSSASAAIASVNSLGLVTAVSAGTTQITVTSEGKSAIATINVTAPAPPPPPPPVPVASVSVSPASSNLLIGATVQLLVTALDANGNVLTGRVVTSSSANAAIASVNSLGLVTAVSIGTTQITVTSEGKSANATIIVSAPAPVPVASVTVSPTTSTLVIGATLQLLVTAFDASNNVLTGRVVTSSSAAPSIASVNSLGLVTAVSAGTTQITVTSEGKSANATIIVSPAAPAPVATVSVSPSSASLQIGATVQLSAVTRDASNNTLTGRVITWSSSNGAVSTVSGSGLVTAIAAGSATITATSETKTGTSAITVSAPAPAPVASVTVAPTSPSLLVGATVQLSATTRDASNNVLTGRVVTWSSPNSGMESVSSNGLVTANGAGTVQISATSEGMTGSASVTATTPPPPPPPGSSNEPTGMTLIDERPFNSLAEHAYPYAPSWDTDSNLLIVSDATAPKSPSNVLRTTFPTGFAGGTAPGHAGVPFTGHRVLYISYWAKYSTNWWGHLTGVNKHGYAWANGNPVFVMEAEAVGSAPMTLRMAIQGSPNSDRWYTPNLVPGATITRGVWFHLEYVVVGNTAGNNDGTMDFWLDGVHVGSFSGLGYTSGTTSWDTFEWRPIWGGVSDVVPATQTLDVDDIYLSGKN